MFSFLKKRSTPKTSLTTDVHSHLLPGLDDGVKSFEEAAMIIGQFQKMGYHKAITTPHVMQDTFRNTTENIASKLKELQQYLDNKGIKFTVEAAAEYYLDETLMKRVEQDEPLLTFGNRYLLFETNFLSEPLNLKEFIFLASAKGYRPVLAHPERYLYLQSNQQKVEDLINRNVLFQVNINSLTGYYSKPVQTLASKLIDQGFVHLLGSDCHHLQHTEAIAHARQSRLYEKALTLPLLNNTL